MICPGDLVFSTRMSNNCGSGYDLSGDKPRLTGGFDTFTGPAMVIAVVVPGTDTNPGILALLLPRRQKVVFAMSPSVWGGP